MATEPGHIQISEFSRDVIPTINLMLEDLFCRYGTSMPWFMCDFDFPDYSERPDWVSGYNFNLDWGAWGYWLPWFNNLLGLLFDTANLPRWQMPDLRSVDMFNSKMSELYDESALKVSIFAYKDGAYKIIPCTRNCAVGSSWAVDAQVTPGNYVVQDSNRNTIQVNADFQVIKKYNESGTEVASVATEYTQAIAIGPNGYIWEYGNTSTPAWGILKRDPDDLSVLAEFDLPDHSQNWAAIALDSDGYIYILNNVSGGRVEKWDFDAENLVASHTFTRESNWLSLAVAGSLVAVSDNTSTVAKGFWTMPTSLDADQTYWTLISNFKVRGVSALEDSYFLIVGYDSGDEYEKLLKYNLNQEKIQEQRVGHTDNTSLRNIGTYPF